MPGTASPAWPEGVIGRYVTVGGATVDITSGATPHWHCTACPGTSRGAYTGPFGNPFTLAEIHEQAQAHAEKCRSLARPTA
ncbi:hypothetical protein [Streptomyces sp. NPDC126499]|uniref:hypothetical protein n=1 Tax=Streptomyces sp. NPDC126499 TaxID=3155314 RepID=UPI0033218239